MNKDELRKVYKQKREQLTEKAVANYSYEIGTRVLTWLSEHPEVRHLHSFLPAREKNEIDTFSIIRRIRTVFPDIDIAVPRVVRGKPILTHHLFTDETYLKNNRWGIPEPASDAAISPAKIDIVLVPMLICDVLGQRVGYGGGYYDRFLADCRPDTWKIGVSFFEPVDRVSDTNEFDVPLDACMTPGKVWNFKK